MAKDLVSRVFGNNFEEVKNKIDLNFNPEKDKKIPFYINETLKGQELVDIKYEQIWNDSPLPHENPENAFRVILGDFLQLKMELVLFTLLQHLEQTMRKC